MELEPREKHLRVQSARSSTGCLTCKSRRIKCDETRPQCQRCLRSNRSCEYSEIGPSQTLKKIIVYEVPRPLKENPDYSHSERRAMYYFRCEAAFEMHAPFHSRLWIDCIFQLAEKHDFVMSALVALSALHESYTLPHEQQQLCSEDPMHHYSKAMRDISRVNSSEMPIPAVLISSILFYSLESLRGSFYHALLHIQSAIKIVGQTLHDKVQPSFLAASLHRDFLSVQNQIMELGSWDLKRAYDPMQGFNPPLPQGFETVDDALYHMEIIYNEIHCIISYCEKCAETGNVSTEALFAEIGPQYEQTSRRFGQWNTAFADLESMLNGGLDERQHQSFLILKIYQLFMRVFFENLFTGECFKRLDKDISHILNLIHAFLQNDNCGVRGTDSTFSLSLGVIPLLFLFSYRCEHISLRERSLELLRDHKRLEGIWDSEAVLKVARAINVHKYNVSNKETERKVHIIKISFVSNTICELTLAITEPLPEKETLYPHESAMRKQKHVELIHL